MRFQLIGPRPDSFSLEEYFTPDPEEDPEWQEHDQMMLALLEHLQRGTDGLVVFALVQMGALMLTNPQTQRGVRVTVWNGQYEISRRSTKTADISTAGRQIVEALIGVEA